MKRVCVLLSTYNGEKYLFEQLESLANQDYLNFHVYIRDDGSNDSTIDIIHKFTMDERFSLFEGNNIGYHSSFLWLLKHVYGDYYMYCDQDDIWLPNKISLMTEKMQNDSHVSLMFARYFINRNCNDDYILSDLINYKINYINAIYECIPLGCNMIFNNCTREALLKLDIRESKTHDWLTVIIASQVGEIKNINEPLMIYRRHSSTSSFSEQSKYSIYINKIKKFIFCNYFNTIKKTNLEIATRVNDVDLPYFKLIKCDNFASRLKRTFYRHRYRSKNIDEIIVRTLIILGLI